MRSTADVTEQVWLDWFLNLPAAVICRAYGLSAAGLRALLLREVASYERWRRLEGLDVLHLVCPRCGGLTGPQLGMRRRGSQAVCCLCALREELGEEDDA